MSKERSLEEEVLAFPSCFGFSSSEGSHYMRLTKELLASGDNTSLQEYLALLQRFSFFREVEFSDSWGYYSDFTARLVAKGKSGHPYVVGSEYLLSHGSQ